ncbi:transposase [Treponema endosymbiont of Eucomonympha sp.]|uniref:transposase n=1 Tax=Treponema endosymbiont of Eucomonympha sp. TaxID=1580831 RepID=UPI0007817C03|nr:transposase [Treponema endosymbiont of Eucomonympha sp.]
MKRNEGIHRHDISDEAWERIKDLLPGQAGKHGRVAKDNRLFINAAAWQTRTGAPWRDIPPEFGNWNSIHKRFCRWRDKGIWKRLADAAIGEPAGGYSYDRFDVYQGTRGRVRGVRRHSGH